MPVVADFEDLPVARARGGDWAAWDSLLRRFQLPFPQRVVLLLHFIEDFSLEEIASITQSQLGWNETDDAGFVVRTRSGLVDWSQGDWVWSSIAESR